MLGITTWNERNEQTTRQKYCPHFWLTIFPFVAITAGCVVLSWKIIDPVDHATTTYRHEYGNFTIINYGTVTEPNRNPFCTLNLLKLPITQPSYECWATTTLSDEDLTLLMRDCRATYHLGDFREMYYNPDGSSCGFRPDTRGESAVIAVMFIIWISWMFATSWYWKKWEEIIRKRHLQDQEATPQGYQSVVVRTV